MQLIRINALLLMFLLNHISVASDNNAQRTAQSNVDIHIVQQAQHIKVLYALAFLSGIIHMLHRHETAQIRNEVCSLRAQNNQQPKPENSLSAPSKHRSETLPTISDSSNAAQFTDKTKASVLKRLLFDGQSTAHKKAQKKDKFTTKRNQRAQKR